MKTPMEITETLWERGLDFLKRPAKSLVIGGILAGVFVGIAALTTVTVTSDMQEYFGLGFTRFIAGIIFSFGLITIVLSGSELFTGSNLYVVCLWKEKKYLPGLLKNWLILYIANFIGSVLLIVLILGTGIFDHEMIGNELIEITRNKLDLTWMQAFTRGIMCNFLVCLAIRVGEAAEEVSGKILGYIYVIGAFVINAFEHSVANMFFIPTGIILANRVGMSLSWQSFFIGNLLPVTLGNVIGGGLLIGCSYYILHRDTLQDKKIKHRVGA